MTFCVITALIEIHWTHFDLLISKNKNGNLGERKKRNPSLQLFLAVVFFIPYYICFRGPCSFIVCLSLKIPRTCFWTMTLTLTKWSKSLQIELQRFIVEYLRSCFELYSRVGPSGNDKHIIARRTDDTKWDLLFAISLLLMHLYFYT